MKLIPVVDLKNSTVVAARHGQRDAYLPLVSPLCRSSRPDAVVEALLSLYPFDILYLADLDAIGGSGNHTELIGNLRRQHPRVVFWVDNGLTALPRLQRFARPVIGSESLDRVQTLQALRQARVSPVLSLDFKADTFLGPASLLDQPRVWPNEVIAMSLSRVGSDSGPDLALLHKLRKQAPQKKIYAAGGVRHHADLRQLAEIGVDGVLLSTALHRGQIDPATATAGRFE